MEYVSACICEPYWASLEQPESALVFSLPEAQYQGSRSLSWLTCTHSWLSSPRQKIIAIYGWIHKLMPDMSMAWVGSGCIWLFVEQYNAATTRYTQRCSYSAIPYSALYRLPYNTAVLIKFTWTTKHTSNPVAHMPCRVSMERETARTGGVVKVMEGVSVVFACLYWLSTNNTYSLLSGLLQ